LATIHVNLLKLKNNKKASWSLYDQAIVSGCNFLTGLILARSLGLSAFGTYTLGWSAILFTVGIQTALIINPMMSLGPKEATEATSKYYAASFIHQCIFSVSSFLFVAMLAPIFLRLGSSPELEYLVLPLAAVMLTYQLQDFLRKYQHTILVPKSAFFNDLICYGGQVILLAYFSFVGGLSITLAMWSIAATSLLAFCIYSWQLPKLTISLMLVKSLFVKNWYFSCWLLPASLAQWVTGNVFLIVANSVLGSAAVGAIKSAQNIMGVNHVLYQTLENYLPTRAAGFVVSNDISYAWHYVRRIAIAGFVIISFVSLAAMLFSDQIMIAVYGSEFSDFSYVLVWYGLISPFVYISIILRIWLRTIENSKMIFHAYALMALIACVVSYPLANGLGMHGVMLGMLASHVTMVLALATKMR